MAHAAAVVVGHHDDLPRLANTLALHARLVFHNDVLADVARKEAPEDGFLRHVLHHVQHRAQQGKHEGHDACHGKQECQQEAHERKREIDKINKIRIRHAVDVLDLRMEPGTLMHPIRYVKGRLLFLFGSSWAGAHLLREIRHIIHQFSHIFALSKGVFVA